MKPPLRQILHLIITSACLAAGERAHAQFSTPPPEIVSAWKHNTENLVVIFRHDGVFYIVDGDGGETGQPGMERGTFTWDKSSGAFSANVFVDTNGDAGFSDPNGTSSISISGNTLTYNVTGEGDYIFTRIVNTPSAIVGSWHLPGQDANLTFLANGTYYHSEESDNEPDSTTGMERGNYTWNSGTGALSANPITDTNGDIGLSDPAPSFNFTISGNVMTITEGADTYTLRRINPILSPLNTENDFEVDKFANHRQTSASAPSSLAGPPTDDQPFWGEAYIEDTVSGTGGTMTITGQAARDFVDDFGWGIETEYTSLAALNAASAFPNGANYLFSRTGGTATLSFPANGTFPPAPAVVSGDGNGSWNNGEFILGENQTLIWSAHSAYDPATLVTVLSVVDQGNGDVIFDEEVIQGDIASFDFRGKLTSGRSYDVQLEHVKIADSTTSGNGPFAGKLGYALYNTNTRFTMVVPEVQFLFIRNEKEFRQQSLSLLTEVGAGFDVIVNGVGITEIFPASSISFRKPDNSSLDLGFDEDHWEFDSDLLSFTNLSELRNTFPTGTYNIDIGDDSIPIAFTGTAFPNQPIVSSSVGTWVNGKLRITATEAASAFTLSTNPNSGNGWSRIIILDATDAEIVTAISNTPENPPPAVVAQISAGLLSVGQSYEVEADFGNTVERIAISGTSWASTSAKGYELLSNLTYVTIEVVADSSAGYTTWQTGAFTPTQLADPAISGDDADFDNDGLDTLLEFILGSSPTASNANLLKNATTTPAPGGRNLVFFYDRKTAANAITQVMETSPTLTGTWTPAIHGVDGVVISTSTLDGQTERITATIPSTETKLFVRLKAMR